LQQSFALSVFIQITDFQKLFFLQLHKSAFVPASFLQSATLDLMIASLFRFVIKLVVYKVEVYFSTSLHPYPTCTKLDKYIFFTCAVYESQKTPAR
jgi:hypothetical protein